MTHQGKLIVFEGPDGVGKSTLAREVAQRLREAGVGKVHELSFPTGAKDSLGQVVYRIHHDLARFGIKQLDRTSLQVLHIAAHIDTIETTIRPALAAGEWVVLDRYWWSTWAYGMANGVPRESLTTMIDLERIHWRGLTPDRLMLIDRTAPFRAESDDAYFQELRRLYTRLEQEQGGEVAVHKLSNDGTVNEAVDQCMRAVTPLLECGESIRAEGSR